jgi:hypothetical protein
MFPPEEGFGERTDWLCLQTVVLIGCPPMRIIASVVNLPMKGCYEV